jgi:hypothetical protein
VGKRALQITRALEVGRVMNDGVDEEEAQAARLNGWIIWEVEEWVAPD